MAKQEKVTVLAAGDISHMEDPEKGLGLVGPILQGADIAFCQLERVLSERANPAWHWGVVAKDPDRIAKALANAGFNVISTAGNMTMMAGPEGCEDTINFLKQYNIFPVGTGMNIAEARTPAIVERKGTKVAFLGYCSIIPRAEEPWEARLNRPGLNPLFINTFYNQIDFHPGTPPRIDTFAEKETLVAIEEDMRRARAQADVVIMSVHWGVHHIPAVIAKYEYEVAHAAVDAGADLILGHGPHLLKGIEVYKGKLIFHSLGNFCKVRQPPHIGLRGYWEDMRPPHTSLRELGWSQYPGTPSSIFLETNPEEFPPPEERLSMIVKCIISGKKIERVSFRPCMINKAYETEPLSQSDKRSDEVYRYVEWACKEAGMDTRFSREGDDVVVLT